MIMHAVTEFNNKTLTFDLNTPYDISIPLQSGPSNVNAFFIPEPIFKPLIAEGFTGSVAQGGSCNCENISFNAHGNATHTECVGHISRERITINQTLKNFFFVARLITIAPFRMENGDHILLKEAICEKLGNFVPDALVIRTLPNGKGKLNRTYSGTNPPYLHWNAAKYLRENGVKHLLLDLPSVDREQDAGEMLAHKAWWNYPEAPLFEHTITELIYVSDEIPDGTYLLNIQIASFESDASPSKPILYPLTRKS